MSSVGVIGFGLFFILCMVSASKAHTELEETPFQDDQEILREVNSQLQNIQSLLDPNLIDSDSPDTKVNCTCSGLMCKCCRLIRVRLIKLNDTCCVSVTYRPQSIGFLTALKIGNRILFSKEIAVRKPVRICAKVPFLMRGASVCVQLKKLRAGKACAHGCVNFWARLLYVPVSIIKVGCFDLKFADENQPQEAVELPYYDSPEWIEAQQPFQTDDDDVMVESIEQPLKYRNWN